MMELADVEAPTFAMGASIDKYLRVPGVYNPSTVLPPSDTRFGEWGLQAEHAFYPARVLEYEDSSNHSPALLALPCDPEERKGSRRKRSRVGRLTDQHW